jgi:hypothetical protein
MVNLDQIGRTTSTDSSASFISAEFDDGTANANDLYWKSWSSVTATTDSMSWVERGSTGNSYQSCKVKVGCLPLASPALETFVPLCALSLDYSDPIVHGTVGDGSYPADKFCANQPLRNYYSPVAQAPLAFAVPITPATFRAGATGPRHPYFNFHSSDLDGHQMQQRLPVRRASAAASNQNLGEACLQWAAQADGSRRLVPMEGNLCRSFFDLDRDASRAQGNWVVLNVSEAAATAAAAGADPYAPLWTQSLRRSSNLLSFSCASATGCSFGGAPCTATTGCNDDTAQVPPPPPFPPPPVRGGAGEAPPVIPIPRGRCGRRHPPMGGWGDWDHRQRGGGGSGGGGCRRRKSDARALIQARGPREWVGWWAGGAAWACVRAWRRAGRCGLMLAPHW